MTACKFGFQPFALTVRQHEIALVLLLDAKDPLRKGIFIPLLVN